MDEAVYTKIRQPGDDMGELIQLIFEYQSLVARRDRLHERLDPQQSTRVQALERLVMTPEGASLEGEPDKRRHPRVELDLPATLYRGVVPHEVVITELGGGGLGLGPGAPALEPGEAVVVHYADPDTAFECRMLCRVCWSRRRLARGTRSESHQSSGSHQGFDEPSAVGLAFTGMPLLLRSARIANPLASVGVRVPSAAL